MLGIHPGILLAISGMENLPALLHGAGKFGWGIPDEHQYFSSFCFCSLALFQGLA